MARKLAVLVVSCATTFGGVAAAAADAPPNDDNCAGAFASALLPELASDSPGSFGEARRTLAQAGLVDDAEREATGLLAGCGTP